jgi:hypothetical protein
MPVIIKALVGSISLMMHNTVTATPIASPTALNTRLMKAFDFNFILLLLALLCVDTFCVVTLPCRLFDDSNIKQIQLKRNNNLHKLPELEHEFPKKEVCAKILKIDYEISNI